MPEDRSAWLGRLGNQPDQVRDIFGVEALLEAPDVQPHRAGVQAQPPRNLLGRETLREQAEHLALPPS